MIEDTLVVIPTYNEIENIEDVLSKVFSLKYPFHVLVVDDNSPDGTAKKVEELLDKNYKDKLFLLKRAGKQGLGKAYIAGFDWALNQGYDYVCQMDADLSHDPNDLPKLRTICGTADFAIGSRYITGVNVVNWPLGRVLLSYLGSKYVNFILQMKVKDTTAGFSCIRTKVLESIGFKNLKANGYGFQIELKYRAWRKKFKLKETSIIFRNRELGTSKMNSKIVFEALYYVLVLKLKRMFGRL